MKSTIFVAFALYVTIAIAQEAKDVPNEARLVKEVKVPRVNKLKGFLRKIDVIKETEIAPDMIVSKDIDAVSEIELSTETQIIIEPEIVQELNGPDDISESKIVQQDSFPKTESKRRRIVDSNKIKAFHRKINANHESKMVQETKVAKDISAVVDEIEMIPETPIAIVAEIAEEVKTPNGDEPKIVQQTESKRRRLVDSNRIKGLLRKINAHRETKGASEMKGREMKVNADVKNLQQDPAVDANELNELKLKLAEPLSKLRNEYQKIHGSDNFFLNLIRSATKEQQEAGTLYTIRALLGIPPVNCELNLFETDDEYTLHAQCGGYRFVGGLKPVNGQRVKRDISTNEYDADLLIPKIQDIFEQLENEQGAHLALARITNGKSQIASNGITRWIVTADLILPTFAQAACELEISEQTWTAYRDVTIKCDQNTYRIARGELS